MGLVFQAVVGRGRARRMLDDLSRVVVAREEKYTPRKPGVCVCVNYAEHGGFQLASMSWL